jgi:hypothetical protein
MLSRRLPAGGNSFDLSNHRSNLIVVPGDSTAFGGVPHAIFDSSSAAAEACARDLDAIIAAASPQPPPKAVRQADAPDLLHALPSTIRRSSADTQEDPNEF